jgi:hypothetical protein
MFINLTVPLSAQRNGAALWRFPHRHNTNVPLSAQYFNITQPLKIPTILAKPLGKVPYNIRQEPQIVGIIVAHYNNNCLGTSVSIPKKDSCSLVYAATGPLSPGRRFFIYQK